MMNIGKIDLQGRPVISQGDFEIGISADSGSSQTISNNDSIDFDGGTGIQTVITAPNILTFKHGWDYESILGSSGSFDVTLNTISTWSTNVKSIVVEFGLRSTVSATTDTPYIFFNNDTTVANYYRQILGSVAGATAAAADATPTFGQVTANTSPSNSFSLGRIEIAMPNSTNYIKMAKISFSTYQSSATLRNDNGSVVWATGGTSAITRIQIRTDNHPTDLYAQNSYIRMLFLS